MLNDTLMHQSSIEKVDERYMLYFQGSSVISDHDIEAERMQYPRGYQLKFTDEISKYCNIAYGMFSYAANTRNSTMKINKDTIKEL